MNLENLPISMLQANLDHTPQFPLPTPFSLRGYQPGDEANWVNIHLKADKYSDISNQLFFKEFGEDSALLAERQFYLCHETGAAIGTASAWFNPNYNEQAFGKVHWVALDPAYQGQGLAKPLLTAVCNRLRALGHQQTYLHTSTARIPAINLYLNFGFIPEIRHQEDIRAWQVVKTVITHPALSDI